MLSRAELGILIRVVFGCPSRDQDQRRPSSWSTLVKLTGMSPLATRPRPPPAAVEEGQPKFGATSSSFEPSSPVVSTNRTVLDGSGQPCESSHASKLAHSSGVVCSGAIRARETSCVTCVGAEGRELGAASCERCNSRIYTAREEVKCCAVRCRGTSLSWSSEREAKPARAAEDEQVRRRGAVAEHAP